jgi:integrase
MDSTLHGTGGGQAPRIAVSALMGPGWSGHPGTPLQRAQIIKAETAAWKKALKRAGIEDFRWHDLRHTWASWHVQSGTPLHVLQELSGWTSFEMVRKYAHLAPEHLAAHAARIETGLRVLDVGIPPTAEAPNSPLNAGAGRR